MARSVLLLFGLAFILWGVFSLFASQYLPDWLGVTPEQGEAFIDFHSINTGLWPGLGFFSLVGATVERLRISAILGVLVCTASIAGGRIIALVLGGQAEVYTSIGLALELAIVAAFSVADVAEKTRIARAARAKSEESTHPDPKHTEPATPSAMQQ